MRVVVCGGSDVRREVRNGSRTRANGFDHLRAVFNISELGKNIGQACLRVAQQIAGHSLRDLRQRQIERFVPLTHPPQGCSPHVAHIGGVSSVWEFTVIIVQSLYYALWIEWFHAMHFLDDLNQAFGVARDGWNADAKNARAGERANSATQVAR